MRRKHDAPHHTKTSRNRTAQVAPVIVVGKSEQFLNRLLPVKKENDENHTLFIPYELPSFPRNDHSQYNFVRSKYFEKKSSRFLFKVPFINHVGEIRPNTFGFWSCPTINFFLSIVMTVTFRHYNRLSSTSLKGQRKLIGRIARLVSISILTRNYWSLDRLEGMIQAARKGRFRKLPLAVSRLTVRLETRAANKHEVYHRRALEALRRLYPHWGFPRCSDKRQIGFRPGPKNYHNSWTFMARFDRQVEQEIQSQFGGPIRPRPSFEHRNRASRRGNPL